MLKFVIKPFDILFFRDSKPFDIGGVASSIFPPFPHTFAGAISSIIYQDLKINDFKVLEKVYGPFLYNEKQNKTYFPKPADIYKEKKKEKINNIFSLELYDDNKLSLFKFSNSNKPDGIEKFPIYLGPEEVEGFNGFISENGLQKWINGQEICVEDIAEFKDIFEYENRVGIKQSMVTHTVVEEDGLYRIKFLRLKQDWSFVFYAEFNMESLPKELKDENKIKEFYESKIPRVLKLGGEMKTAFYRVEIEDIKQRFKMPVLNEKFFKILFLTPATFDSVLFPEGNGIKVISALINGFVNISIFSERCGLINFAKRGIKAGSVFYLEKTDSIDMNKYRFDVFFANDKFFGSNLVIYGKVKLKQL